MKTTIDLPDDLLIETKKRAADQRTTIRAIIERALRRELHEKAGDSRTAKPRIRWVTAPGGVPAGLDLSNRDRMTEWLERNGRD
jgi:hypothetical protein